MKVFLHINDFGSAGFNILPTAILACSKVAVWAPSARLLRSSSSPIDEGGFIKLVKAGHIQVVARRSWYDRDLRRDTRWAHSPWTPGFDSELADMAYTAEQNNELPQADRRVVIADAEKGRGWAERAVNGKRKNKIVENVRAYLTSEDAVLPAGIAEKLTPLHGEDRVMQVLRDMHNHSRAHQEIGAQRTLIPSPDYSLLRLAYRGKRVNIGRDEVADQGTRYISLLDKLRDLSVPRDVGDILRLKRLLEHERIDREVDLLENSDVPLDILLRTQTMRPTIRPILGFRGQGWDRFQIGLSGVGFVLSTIALTLSPVASVGLVISGLSATSSPTKSLLERTSLKRAPGYSGLRLPFLLAFNSAHPTFKQIDELHEMLRS